jgi:YbbR domain-containing protein
VVFEHLAEGRIVREPDPAEVLVTVSGPKLRLENLESAGINVTLDVRRAKEGLNRHTVTDAEIPLPRGVMARDVQPKVVAFKVDRIVDVKVPVQPNTVGKLPSGLWLKKLSVTPTRVKLRAPRSRATLRHVATEAVPLDAVRQDSDLERELLLPRGIELAPGEPTQVVVHVRVGGKLP